MNYLIKKINYGSNNHGYFVSDSLPVANSFTTNFKQLRQLHKDNYIPYVTSEKDMFDTIIEMLKRTPQYSQTLLCNTFYYSISIVN